MSRPNCSVITEAPAELVEIIWFRLGIWPNCTLQRRGDRGGHHVRAGAGIEGLHLDGRVVDLGQRRERQEAVGDACPTSMIATISSVVATGRRMNGRDGFIAVCAVAARTPLRCRRGCVGRRRRAPSGAAAGAASARRRVARARLTLAPSRSWSAPSTTTRSPGASPERTATRSPSVGAELHRAHRDGVVGVDDDRRRCRARRAGSPAVGITRDVLQRVDQQADVDELVRETACSSSLSNWARSLTVPVVVSIWLSKVGSVPVGELVAPAAVEGRRPAASRRRCSRFEIAGRLSSGTVNTR